MWWMNLTLAQYAAELTSQLSENADQASRWAVELRDYLFQQGPVLLLNLIAALVIFLIGRMIALMLVQVSATAMRRSRVDDTLVRFVKSILYWALLAFVVMAALERVGVSTTSFAAVVAAAGLAVGLALQNSLSNFASGVLLILFHPFRVGNFVEAGGTTGIVEEIQIFNTVMRTPDNVQIIVPNGQITSSSIRNFAAHPIRRIDLTVMCGYDDNLRDVKDFLEELLAADSRILDDPAPLVRVNELADHGVNLVVRPWVANAQYWEVRWSLMEEIKNGFDDRGFQIPYPTRDVHVHQHDNRK